MSTWLEIDNATVYRDDTCVFDGLTLAVDEGQHTAVIGPNGAGKSTLLKLISREIYPVVQSNSHLRILGQQRPLLADIRRFIGLVSQDLQDQYLPHVTGLDVVISGLHGSIGLWKHQDITDQQQTLAMQTMNHLGIGYLADSRYREMSTGQQRLCLLGRAMIHEPRHYVLDEPTSGLDIRATFEYLHRISKLAQQGRTLLLVTHHIHEIPPEIERLVFLKSGKIIADSDKQSLLTADNLSALFDTHVELKKHRGYFQAFPGAG